MSGQIQVTKWLDCTNKENAAFLEEELLRLQRDYPECKPEIRMHPECVFLQALFRITEDGKK